MTQDLQLYLLNSMYKNAKVHLLQREMMTNIKEANSKICVASSVILYFKKGHTLAALSKLKKPLFLDQMLSWDLANFSQSN